MGILHILYVHSFFSDTPTRRMNFLMSIHLQLHSSVSLSSELVVGSFDRVSLTVASSPVRSAACTSTSLRVLAAVDRSTELKCCGPFVSRCKLAYVRPV